MSGTTRVCITATTMPAKESTATMALPLLRRRVSADVVMRKVPPGNVVWI
jgi:hypothetical protein